MTVEEVFAWRELKSLAWKVYGQFHALPGCYLEADDFHIVGVAAVATKLGECAEADRGLLWTIAHRRMIDYGRSCSDVARSNALAENYRGLRGVLPLTDMECSLHSDSSPLQSAVGVEVRSWVEIGRFGLTEREVMALRMRYWYGSTLDEIGAQLGTKGRSKSLVCLWLRSAKEKIRSGLKLAELEVLRDRAEYHRQLRARSAECR